MKTVFRVTIVSFVVSLVAMSAFAKRVFADNTPQAMHISCTAPNPEHQTGLHRPKGDGSHWIFSIILEGGARFVDGPHWVFPGSDGNDPDWGLVTGGKDKDSSMDWSSPGKTGEFKVRVSGQITCGNGGNGAPIDFSVGWDAEVYPGVQKIQYKLNHTWTDFPAGGLSDICKNASISFKAIAESAGATWPAGKPVWGGDATGTGEETTVTFSTAGARTVTVECGNTVTASLEVVDHPIPEVTVAQITPASYRSSMGARALGQTDVESLDMEITACHDGTEWHAVLTKMNGNYSIRTRMSIPGIVSLTEVTGPGGAAPGTTNATNSCTQVTDLQALGANVTAWYIESATVAHENVHASRCEPALASTAQYIGGIIDVLAVPDTGQSKAEAIAQLKASTTWSNVREASFTRWLDNWLDLINHDHGLGAGNPITTSGPDEGYAYIVEGAVVAPMINVICSWRATQTPPLTGCAVCGD